ncbi:molybdopterin-guanine dinucleotide biosynthesis protein B [Gluconacetobacter diazotrophicus PA1 5]|uniref:Putatie molybdopterin-guanine dinucleotide biosynthesis protein B n=2 Tax=Gluconacetobacter diazotrophicus TaxID=33996 RepID=A9H261_GLUDA|nr:molybdopterin-guanine dinucleotide biosynthesis protein B [Gluconacetobacter diazotrophicus]ACI51991.1 molybdopterin-guanine dinucleotide biosynthesis protein B [Gluconacetobacter diazotrophicus PA1 5]MBB2158265.1 molybdopterin-guanine dinucleotide biosynthesis protein B [Gluconacetobacter diazotrophicus]TWB05184.1 molybdopterin guanine dinucleotide biosynthesis accessory protein MobB [Gluconacetobacter diazotrophicus]CAP54109.1 putatie molybdopterin-guanine dinucleotide biosynthesis protein
MRTPAIMGITGRSGAGKTTLVVRLLAALGARGLRVSTVKHAHHGFDMDQPGKDSHRHREAGAREVMVASGTRWALLHECAAPGEPALPDLIARMAPVDLILVEGFRAALPVAIEVYRPDVGKDALWPATPHIAAVATDAAALPLPPGLARLDLADTAAITDFILARACPLPAPAGAA